MIRRRLLPPMLALALAACAPPGETTGSGRAGLIVGLPDGSIRTACVSFEGSSTSGRDLLRASGWSLSMDETNPMGPLVCAVEGQGCDFPTQDCLCQCGGTRGCSYWAYFNRQGDGDWTYGALGAGQRRVHDGDLDAWIWLDRARPEDPQLGPPPDLTFAGICG